MEVQHSERQELLSLIRNTDGVIRKGCFDLSAGGVSDHYFDLRKITLTPRGINLVTNDFLRKMDELDVRVTKVGGYESASIPIISAMVQKSMEHGYPLEGFWVRKKAKRYADKARIAGNLSEGDNVLLVDDTFTTGTSFIKAAKVVARYGAKAVAAFSIMNRAAEATFEILGIPYSYIFAEKEVLEGWNQK